MISEKHARSLCAEPINRIKNYEQAVSDKKRRWRLHHVLEVAFSRAELIDLGFWSGMPADDFVFKPAKPTRRGRIQRRAAHIIPAGTESRKG